MKLKSWGVMLLACVGPLSVAATLRVANQGDAQAMDPRSLNESLPLTCACTERAK